jgi:phosphoglycolate phosphatase-like HAD superfamily hydrolase
MGIKLMISSATPELTLKNIILKRGWGPMFSDIYGFPASKEQHVTEIMGTWQCSAENILYVGDSEIDRRAALRAGCYFAGVGNDTSRFDIIPEHMLEDLRELPSFVMQHP